ncbi:MAG: DUF1788 domain-containing protein [Clostridium cochlearium]|uniref:DUF1788 domain-containing protein n=1 Tax=Clostridium cochlearium TaxID=1494 RepID=UPI00280AB869|nr:DUF1788 domain-containing protein [Clostridium cochlearium]MDU1443141.1 DUF1788 domain-containing protein [Clostridium cochlearium]
MSNINEKLDRLRKLIQDSDFLTGKGLSNEVNIRMFCYEPEDEMAVRHFTKQLKNDNSLDCNLICHNLYHVFLEICEEKNLIKKILKMEEKKGSDFLQEKILKFSTTEAFAEKMQYEPHKPGDVLLLTGVGEVFPFMRVHSLLDELQTGFDDIPIVVLYPGSFDGRSVTLFNEFKSNEYYRAFNII